MTDWLTPEQRRNNMTAIRSTGTSAERALASALHEAFPRRRVLQQPPLPGRPDFYLPGLRLAVFADGCFWHGCPEHGHMPSDNRGYWTAKLTRNASRDRSVVRTLREMGIRSIRIWHHDLRRKTINIAVLRLRRAAAKPLPSAPRTLGRSSSPTALNSTSPAFRDRWLESGGDSCRRSI
jgi:DNA mismatch endonuclease (patch repair protein)